MNDLLEPGALRYYATITDKDAYQTVVTLIGGGILKLPIPTDLSIDATVWVTMDSKGYVITAAPDLGTEMVIEV